MQVNAKAELQQVIGTDLIIAAEIMIQHMSENDVGIELKVNSSAEDLEKFYDSLDFGYDNGYGWQHIRGTVWVMDTETGSMYWLERGEYDGSEWWDVKKIPTIPANLLSRV